MKRGKSPLYWLADGPGLLRVFGVSWNPDGPGSHGFLHRVLPGGRRYAGLHRRRRKAARPVGPATGSAALRFAFEVAAAVR